jgi:hypothetical protein
MNIRSISPSACRFVWFFSQHCSTLACLMSLASLPPQWPQWPHPDTVVEVPLSVVCAALHCTACNATPYHTHHHDTMRGEAAQHKHSWEGNEHGRIEFGCRGQPLGCGLIHQQDRAAHFLSSAGKMGRQGSHHVQSCTNLQPKN